MNAAVKLRPPIPLEDQPLVYLSHSTVELYQTCGHRYKLERVDLWRSMAEGCALGFGNAVHVACAEFLESTITRKNVKPVKVFLDEWNRFCNTKQVDFGKVWTKEKLDETGAALVEAFMNWWPTSGYTVLVDPKGKPVVERKFKIRLPGNIVYTAIIDLVARDAKGRVIVLDLKTPAQLSIEGFAELNEQLLGYQVVCDAHAGELGITQVDGMAFIELHKVTVKDPPKKPGSKQPLQPSVAPVEVAERRPNADVASWIKERMAIAQDIRNKRFPKRPGSSFSTPCKMCALYNLCRSSSTEGLYKAQPYRKKQVVMMSNASNESLNF